MPAVGILAQCASPHAGPCKDAVGSAPFGVYVVIALLAAILVVVGLIVLLNVRARR